MIRLLFILFICNVFLFTGGNTNAQDSKSEDLIRFTEQEMSTFLSDIPDARLSDYGIEEHIDLDRAVLGTPIPMYLISQYGTQDAKIWRVPLIIDGFYSALFTVEIDESGELRLVDFGANLLAEELQRINSEIHLEGLLRVFELHKDFAIANVEDGSQLFYPIPWQTADKGLTLENINQLISERQ